MQWKASWNSFILLILGIFSHPKQLQDKVERFRFLHQFVQVIIAETVVGKHVGHAAGVDVPVDGVFSLCNAPHTLRHKWVNPSVLQKRDSYLLNPGFLFTF